ncbi:hypothetical protein SISSUDRAFT_984897 [Sistotremastrum suecicum HHB10207 ss-3]|uniref:Ion transport domain-containing protein n=1 Tax=Sistotremastrum suecicum HHB10207 ss-3 TaxID=1314776 RepID=A0A166EB60_9AGAM|nr:hypothetical protein SISSUDRAFT_984897 [Sistotremastrum suecicum HHB10207 ss-3]
MPLLQEQLDATPVYPTIHMIRQVRTIVSDAPLSRDAILATDLSYTLIRPLEEKYIRIQSEGNKAVVFCFLLNRVQFLRDQTFATAPVSTTRAMLCEILAIRVLRANSSLLDLALVMTRTWPVFNGASDEVLALAKEDAGDDRYQERVGNAIEVAIVGKSKRFIKSPACQTVINAIWSGKCLYQAESNHSFLADTYKRTPIHLYDPFKAPLLDHYRLKVPAVRSVLEYMNFLILFLLFVITLEAYEPMRLNTIEVVFMVYALGFSLERLAAMQEHGLRVFFSGTWNGFDLVFVTIYFSYATLRIYGVYWDNAWARISGFDILSLAACLMFPRLAFTTLSSNLMVLSVRAMLIQFVQLMLIAAFCFAGFLYALWTQIAWWMLDLWFGLDASGFDNATTFHPVFGPMLMISYTCLSSTLLLTILVSILSHTFSTINEDADAEALYRHAVYTIEGVHADAIFSYQPPLNLIALFIMVPAGYIITPRWFHKINVFMIRLTGFPILLTIGIYERQCQKLGVDGFGELVSHVTEILIDKLPHAIKHFSIFEDLMGLGGIDVDAVFYIEDEINENAAVDTQDTPSDEGNQGLIRRRSSAYQSKSPAATLTETPARATGTGSPLSPDRHGFRQRLQSRASRVRLNSHFAEPRPGLSISQQSNEPSPLARLYQPIIVGDDDQNNNGMNSSGGSHYGAITPNRRPSISQLQTHRRAATEPHLPPSHANPQSVSSSASLGAFRFPASTGSNATPINISVEPPNERYPETVQEVEDDMDAGTGGPADLSRRMQAVEQRQKNIEALLERLCDNLGK